MPLLKGESARVGNLGLCTVTFLISPRMETPKSPGEPTPVFKQHHTKNYFLRFRQNFIYFSLRLSLVLPLGTAAKSLTSFSSIAPDMYLYTLIKFSQGFFLHAGESQPLSVTPHVRQAPAHYLCGPVLKLL